MAEESDRSAPQPRSSGSDRDRGGVQSEPSLSFSGYVLEGLIGTGSYGEVWKALAVVHRTHCAIKIVRVAGTTDTGMVERELEGLRRYSRICMEHPALIKVLHSDALPDNGGFFYVMELADPVEPGHAAKYRARTLEEELRAKGRFPVADVVRIGLELCGCIEVLHQKGLVHADIKPSNVLYVGGRLRLGDIGLVSGVADGRRGGGTVGYFPPGSPGTPDADLFGLGKLLYCLATGFDRTAFPSLPSDFHQLFDREHFAAFNQVLTRACANSAQDRYPDIHALARDLAEIADARALKLRNAQRQLRRLKWSLSLLLLLAPGLVVHELRLRERTRLERLRVTSLRVAQGMQQAELGDPALALPHFLAAMDADAGVDDLDNHLIRVGLAWASSPKLESMWHAPGGATHLQADTSHLRFAFGCRQGPAQFVSAVGAEPVEFKFGDPAAETSATLTRDGRFLAIASGNPDGLAKVAVFDTQSRQPVGPTLELPAFVRRFEFSRNPQHLAIACDDGTVRVWNAWTNSPPKPILRHGGQVRSLQFGPDDETLLTAGWDGMARLWNHSSGVELAGPMKHEGYIREARFSPDFERIATCGDDGFVRIWNRHSGQLATPPIEVGTRCLALAFSPDSKSIAVGSFDGTARVFDSSTGRLRGSPVSHRNAVRSVAFSADGQWIATGSNDQTARIWEVTTGNPVTPPLHHGSDVTSISFHSHTNRVLTTSEDGTVRCWLIGRDQWGRAHPFRPADQRFAAVDALHKIVLSESGPNQLHVHPFDSQQPIAGPFDTGAAAISARFAPDGRSFLVTTSASELRLFHLDPGADHPAIIRQHGTLAEDRLHGCFSPDGTRCATAGRDRFARLWNTRDGSHIGPPLHHKWSVGQIHFTRSGRFLVTATSDTYGVGQSNQFETVVWDLEQFDRRHTFVHQAPVSVAETDTGEEWILSASVDRRTQLWSLKDGPFTPTPLPHGSVVKCAAFSPDSRKVATAGVDDTVRIWDVRSGRPIGRPLHHSGDVGVVVFSKDGRRIFTGSDDRTVRIWDANRGEPISPPLQHASAITAIALSPDESRLFTSSRTELLREWRLLDPERTMATIRTDAPLMAGQRIDSDGNFQPLSGDEAWTLWKQRGKEPAESRPNR